MKRNIKRKAAGLCSIVLTLVLSIGSLHSAAAATARATTMRLEKAEGTVSVKSLNGTARKNTTGMRLFNGDSVTTAAKSAAYISLDSTKAIKLDEKTKAALNQRDKNLELTVKSGKMFFNVSKPLTTGESMKVRTSSMVSGVRGTCGIIEAASPSASTLYLLEGSMDFTVVDTETGQKKTLTVKGGEKLTMTKSGTEQTPEVETLEITEIPVFALEEVAADEDLQKKIADTTELNVEDMISYYEAQEAGESWEAPAAATQTASADTTETYVYTEEQADVTTGSSIDSGNNSDSESSTDGGNSSDSGNSTDTGAVTWKLDDSVLTVSGTGAMKDYEYDYEEENTTAPWFEQRSVITGITLENGVTSVGNAAFGYLGGAESVELPQSLERIGEYAFLECSGIRSMELPENVTEIGQAAFSNCRSLTGIQIPDGVSTIEFSTFSGCSGLEFVELPEGLKEIGEMVFYGCSILSEVNISEGVTSIGGYAFKDCAGLEKIAIPTGVTEIKGYTFSGCSNLSEVIIPEGVTSIEGYAFNDCTSLKEITIPASVESISDSAFSGCQNLVIKGYQDSYASTYAAEHKMQFELAD